MFGSAASPLCLGFQSQIEKPCDSWPLEPMALTASTEKLLWCLSQLLSCIFILCLPKSPLAVLEKVVSLFQALLCQHCGAQKLPYPILGVAASEGEDEPSLMSSSEMFGEPLQQCWLVQVSCNIHPTCPQAEPPVQWLRTVLGQLRAHGSLCLGRSPGDQHMALTPHQYD